MDGLYIDNDNSPLSSSSSGSPRQLFDAYRRSFYGVDAGCVPGLAHKERLGYLELADSDLMNSAATQIQRQFYQEAGIKTAVFMGCKSGEIELGMSALNNINMQMDIGRVFSEDFIQQSQLGEFLVPDQSWPSSSSSSLRSLSVGSPEYSSLLLNKASSSYMPDSTLKEITTTNPAIQATPALVSPHQMGLPGYNPYGSHVQFPTATSDDAAITRAMLAVISSSSSSSMLYQPPQRIQAHQSPANCRLGAFKPYNSALAPKSEFKPSSQSQKMIKMAISICRRINLIRAEARMQESRPAATNQLHHMISERKRREKLNDSFHALRLLLPPGSKKDKASVLANTRDYLNTMKAQISDLEEKNRMLETQVLPGDEAKEEAGDSSERISVQITRASESTSELQQINLKIAVRVECDIIDLVLHVLERLKEMRVVSLVSVEANTYSPRTNLFAQATLALQIKASDWDMESFKQAMTRAVDDVARPEPTTP